MNIFKMLVDNMMLPILQFFYGLTGNYGMAIVLLTATIRLLLSPLTFKQQQSMNGMKEVQPKLKEIQTKYKDNPQELQAKMMALYKEHNVNPLGGCLPVLLQLPFFIAIFMALQSEAFKLLIAEEGVRATFFWITDLAGPDKTMILPILVAASMYFSQKTMSVGGANDPQMKMMQFMPILMLFIALNMPAGVLIYWALSQFLTVGQQVLLPKMFSKEKTN